MFTFPFSSPVFLFFILRTFCEQIEKRKWGGLGKPAFIGKRRDP
jgi:hypothetical protein